MMTSRPSIRPYAVPQDNQCDWHIQVRETVLRCAFVSWEVASPTAFKKNKKEILKTTKDKAAAGATNRLCKRRHIINSFIANTFLRSGATKR